jgi:hypothetical protein
MCVHSFPPYSLDSGFGVSYSLNDVGSKSQHSKVIFFYPQQPDLFRVNPASCFTGIGVLSQAYMSWGIKLPSTTIYYQG